MGKLPFVIADMVVYEMCVRAVNGLLYKTKSKYLFNLTGYRL